MTSLWLLTIYACLAGSIVALARWMRRPFDGLTSIGLSILPVIFVLPGVLQDRTPVPIDHVRAVCVPWRSPAPIAPHNATLSDFAGQFAPWAKAVRLAWKEGSLPFRDRWNGCGTPLAANDQSGAFSPFTLAMFALPLARAYVLLGAAKLLIASAGMWLWLVELGLSRETARFGAVCFGFSFAITPWLYHPATAGIAMWPWILFAAEYQDRSGERKGFWLLLALLAIWPLCGHLETVALGSLFALMWLGLRALGKDLEGGPRRIARFAFAGVLALGLSAFLLVPQLHAILASNRLALAKDPNHLAYVPWVPYRPGWLGGFLTSLYPRLFGDAVQTAMIPGAAGSIVEMGFGYVGLIGWACALLAWPTGKARVKQLVLLTLILLGFGCAMGLGVFRLVGEALPGLRFAPPLRFLLLVGFGSSALASFTLERLLHPSGYRITRGILLSAFGLLAVIAILFFLHYPAYRAAGDLIPHLHGLYWTLAVGCTVILACLWALRRPGSSAGLLVRSLTAIACVQLFYEGMRLYRFYPTSELFPPTPLLTFLHKQPGPYRIVGEELAVFPNTNVFAGLEEIRTHDPIERRDYIEFLDTTAGYPPWVYVKRIRDLNAPVLDFLNVRYLIAEHGRGVPGPRWRPVYDAADGAVFENLTVMPRFFAPPLIDVVPRTTGDNHRVRNAMTAFGAPLREFLRTGKFHERALVLEDSSSILRAGSVDQTDRAIRAEVLAESTNRMTLHTESAEGRPSILASSVVQDGGWSARDESGSRLTLCLVNGPFLGIVVPGGSHRIQLSYRPPGFRLGLSVTAVTACLIAAIAIAQRRVASRS